MAKRTFSYFAWLVGIIVVLVALFWFFDLRAVPQASEGGPLQSVVPLSDSISAADAAVDVSTVTTTATYAASSSNLRSSTVVGLVLGAAITVPTSSVPVGGAGIAVSAPSPLPAPQPPPTPTSTPDETEDCDP